MIKPTYCEHAEIRVAFFRFFFQKPRITYIYLLFLAFLSPTSKFYFFGRISSTSNFPSGNGQGEERILPPNLSFISLKNTSQFIKLRTLSYQTEIKFFAHL